MAPLQPLQQRLTAVEAVGRAEAAAVAVVAQGLTRQEGGESAAAELVRGGGWRALPPPLKARAGAAAQAALMAALAPAHQVCFDFYIWGSSWALDRKNLIQEVCAMQLKGWFPHVGASRLHNRKV